MGHAQGSRQIHQPLERRQLPSRVRSRERCDGHQPVEPKPLGSGHECGQLLDSVRCHATPVTPSAFRGIEGDLDQTAQLTLRPYRLGGESGDELRAVHRLHQIGITDHRPHLVGLQLADKVPSERQIRTFGSLGGRILITVLGNVAYTEFRQDPHIARRIGLGDHDEGHLVPLTARRGACLGDTFLNLRQIGGEFSPTVRHALSVQPDIARQPTRDAVAAVGEVVLRLQRAHRRLLPVTHPEPLQLGVHPAVTSTAGVPQLVSAYAAGSTAATSARMSAGTS